MGWWKNRFHERSRWKLYNTCSLWICVMWILCSVWILTWMKIHCSLWAGGFLTKILRDFWYAFDWNKNDFNNLMRIQIIHILEYFTWGLASVANQPQASTLPHHAAKMRQTADVNKDWFSFVYWCTKHPSNNKPISREGLCTTLFIHIENIKGPALKITGLP